MTNNREIAEKSRVLLEAFHSGKLGKIVMPEDTNPGFSEKRLKKGFHTSLSQWP